MRRFITAFSVGVMALVAGAQVFPFPPSAFILIDTLVPRFDVQCHAAIDVRILRSSQSNVYRVDLRDFKVGFCNGARLVQPKDNAYYQNYRSYQVIYDGTDSCGVDYYSGTRTLQNGRTVFFRMLDQRKVKSTCVRNYAPSAVVISETLQQGNPHTYFMTRK